MDQQGLPASSDPTYEISAVDSGCASNSASEHQTLRGSQRLKGHGGLMTFNWMDTLKLHMIHMPRYAKHCHAPLSRSRILAPDWRACPNSCERKEGEGASASWSGSVDTSGAALSEVSILNLLDSLFSRACTGPPAAMQLEAARDSIAECS